MLDHLSWGCLADFPRCGWGYFVSCDRLSLPCGAAMVSACVIPVVWLFCSWYLLLCVIPFLYTWGMPCVAVFQRLACLLALVGMVPLRLIWSSSDLTSVGPWFWLAWCPVMAVSFQTPVLRVSPSLYAWGWLCDSFGQWFAPWLVLVGTSWFPGRFVLGVFSWRRDSDAVRCCCCCYLWHWLLRLEWWWCVGS